MSTTIYTLKLENDKYYVGKSDAPEKRILKHFEKGGSEWTKIHKPISIVSQIQGDAFDEEKYTLIAMEKYGIDNVRGGSYCKIKLTKHEKNKALQTIQSIFDKCYKCGKKGHYSKYCNTLDRTTTLEGQYNYIKGLCDCGINYNDCKCITENNELIQILLKSNKQLEHFIRNTLGQKIFPTPVSPDKKKCKMCGDDNCDKCENCCYIKWYYDEWVNDGHLRFDFNAQKDINHNKQIIDLFNDMLRDNKFIVHTHKGMINALIVTTENYNKYDYWNYTGSFNEHIRKYPHKVHIEDYYDDEIDTATVDIIRDLFKNYLKII